MPQTVSQTHTPRATGSAGRGVIGGTLPLNRTTCPHKICNGYSATSTSTSRRTKLSGTPSNTPYTPNTTRKSTTSTSTKPTQTLYTNYATLPTRTLRGGGPTRPHDECHEQVQAHRSLRTQRIAYGGVSSIRRRPPRRFVLGSCTIGTWHPKLGPSGRGHGLGEMNPDHTTPKFPVCGSFRNTHPRIIFATVFKCGSRAGIFRDCSEDKPGAAPAMRGRRHQRRGRGGSVSDSLKCRRDGLRSANRSQSSKRSYNLYACVND